MTSGMRLNAIAQIPVENGLEDFQPKNQRQTSTVSLKCHECILKNYLALELSAEEISLIEISENFSGV